MSEHNDNVSQTVYNSTDASHPPAVTRLLDDKTHTILSDTPEELSVELRDYLETRKDLRGKIAYWPLIRHVDIFCPADALATGAVLVDLPGVADMNSARNAIAQKFLEQSHHFWIVTPVQRAADDRTALSKSYPGAYMLSRTSN